LRSFFARFRLGELRAGFQQFRFQVLEPALTERGCPTQRLDPVERHLRAGQARATGAHTGLGLGNLGLGLFQPDRQKLSVHLDQKVTCLNTITRQHMHRRYTARDLPRHRTITRRDHLGKNLDRFGKNLFFNRLNANRCGAALCHSTLGEECDGQRERDGKDEV